MDSQSYQRSALDLVQRYRAQFYDQIVAAHPLLPVMVAVGLSVPPDVRARAMADPDAILGGGRLLMLTHAAKIESDEITGDLIAFCATVFGCELVNAFRCAETLGAEYIVPFIESTRREGFIDALSAMTGDGKHPTSATIEKTMAELAIYSQLSDDHAAECDRLWLKGRSLLAQDNLSAMALDMMLADEIRKAERKIKKRKGVGLSEKLRTLWLPAALWAMSKERIARTIAGGHAPKEVGRAIQTDPALQRSHRPRA
ncbi:hypothetical protein [Sulfuriroseicoccus oceanibius]|uniref:Uncharacterized protein n=1 Tax=Sulfuriroseicoccus oceanibius TaxID=2707525 RepID=A0A6B3L9D9_9BACT|nr:hypothetical protein [Sulfuriroseicoccus oceanibius]QQL44228.1 hypothetical protein G3M56_010015 [Sulfuriroseicoccus oceanibius]